MEKHEDKIEKKNRKVIVLVDYENVALEAAKEGKVVDFEGLAALCREYGNVVEGLIFVPKHQLLDDPWFDNAWEHNFLVVVVPPQIPGREKQFKTADHMMTTRGMIMCHQYDIDMVVIVSHDGDFTTLCNEARNLHKQVILVAGDRVARALTKAVDVRMYLPMVARTNS